MTEDLRFTPGHRAAFGTVHDLPAARGCGPHRLFLFVPDGPAPAAGWPLLVATDGNAAFDLAVGMMRTQALDGRGSNVREGVVAAIGYQTDRLYDQLGRCWDLTPPPGRGYGEWERRPLRTGGAGHFLDIVENDVLPWLATRAPIDTRRTTLFGHSFGGLFTLFALYRRPSLFRTYVAACPSLYWEDAAIKPFEEAFFSGLDPALDARLILSAGEWEGAELAPHLRGGGDEAELRDKLQAIAKVERAQALLARFARNGVWASLEVYAGENHMSALAVAINRAVQAAFAIV